MKNTWLSTMITGKTAEGDAISASTLNVTKFVSFFAAIFAGITQVLTSTNVVGLTTTQMVTIWLVVAGFVVLLSITDMICRAYVTAKRYGSGEASLTKLGPPQVKVQKEGEHGTLDAELLGILTGASGALAHVQLKDGNANGRAGKAQNGEDGWVPLDKVTPA